MAQGWESKSVESQQADHAETPQQKSARAAEVRGNIAADADQKRKRQGLELQRERILSERTANPHRRSALEMALADVEEKLSELGWTIHL